LNKLYSLSFKAVKGDDSMTTEDFKRKLTAILSADVVGYSRLMGRGGIPQQERLRVVWKKFIDSTGITTF
jgi:hypothetical protein